MNSPIRAKRALYYPKENCSQVGEVIYFGEKIIAKKVEQVRYQNIACEFWVSNYALFYHRDRAIKVKQQDSGLHKYAPNHNVGIVKLERSTIRNRAY